PAGQLGCVEHLAPGVDGIAGEGRRHVPRAVQPENVEGVGEAVKAQAARDGDYVAAIDEAAAEAALAFDMLVEMHPRRVLEQPRGELVLGLLDGLAVDVVDLLADLIVAPALGRA